MITSWQGGGELFYRKDDEEVIADTGTYSITDATGEQATAIAVFDKE